ncbi:MAG: hypothetical protein KA712_23535 [Myxococcales bacterium]|nr:hypothetical protein [Myxococcales bacterium]
MDLTGWLEFFVEGLATQLAEVKLRGEFAIRRDVLVNAHRLNPRQAQAVEHVLEHGRIDIRTFEALCPESPRRTLQRDLAQMEAMGLLTREGGTNKAAYTPSGKW